MKLFSTTLQDVFLSLLIFESSSLLSFARFFNAVCLI